MISETGQCLDKFQPQLTILMKNQLFIEISEIKQF